MMDVNVAHLPPRHASSAYNIDRMLPRLCMFCLSVPQCYLARLGVVLSLPWPKSLADLTDFLRADVGVRGLQEPRTT